MKTRAYLSHPIAGHDLTAAAERAKIIGDCVTDYFRVDKIIYPMELIPKEHTCPAGKMKREGNLHPDCCYLRDDLKKMLKANFVVMSPGWTQSRGCMIEFNTAIAAGLPVYEFIGGVLGIKLNWDIRLLDEVYE